MTRAHRLLRSTVTVGVGHSVSQVLIFARNIVVARMIGPAEFGIAAGLLMVMMLLEALSTLGIDKFLVQARDGADEAVQSAAHLVQLVRGLLLGAAILALAGPVTAFLDIRHARGAFYLLAAAPLIFGFSHLDMKRIQRGMRFGPDIATELVQQGTSLGIAVVASLWLGDHRAVLWALLAQAVAYTTCSHLLAERRYRASYEPALTSKLIRFGLPIWASGLLMFAAFQGDRVVVAKAFGMEALGNFALAMSLALMPALMIGRVSGSLLLPLLANVKDTPGEFNRRVASSTLALSIIGGALAAVLLLLGPFLISFIYGPNYAAAGRVVGGLGIACGLYIARLAAICACLAKADSVASLHASVARVVGVAGSAGAVIAGGEMVWVAVFACVGEFLAWVIVVSRLRSIHSIPFWISVRPMLALLAVAALAWGGDAVTSNAATGVRSGIVVVLGLISCSVLFAVSREGRQFAKRVVSRSWREANRDDSKAVSGIEGSHSCPRPMNV